MADTAIELLTEIRDAARGRLGMVDAELAALRDLLVELRAQIAMERKRRIQDASARRVLEHEVRELTNRVLVLEQR